MRGRFARWLFDQPYPVLGLTMLVWGSNTVAGRLAVGNVSPMAIVTLRWLVVLLVLGAASGRRIRAELPGLHGHRLRLALLGALGFTGFNALFYWAAHLTTAVNMGLIQGITPALVLLFGLLAYRMPVRALQVAGLAVSLVGVAVVASGGDLAVFRHLTLNGGDLAIAIASALYAAYTVGLRRRPPVSPTTLFAAMAAAAFVTSLPLLAAEVATGAFRWPNAVGLAIVLYIAILPSLISQLLYMRGVALIGPGRAGAFMNLIPVFGAVLAVLILGERFEAYHAVALALVLGGIWMAERSAPAAIPTATAGRAAAGE